MYKRTLAKSILLLAVAAPLGVNAAVCDYRPSAFVARVTGSEAAGTVASTSAVGVTGATAATGAGLKAAGLYAATHATTGAAILGSTAAGASAAGTVGFISGTMGTVATAVAFVMSPAVIVGSAVAAVAVAGYEGSCYLFAD